MPLKVRLSTAAETVFTDLSRTDEKLYRVIKTHLLKLPETYRNDPFLQGVQFQGMRRRRVGDYRIIYQVIHDQLMIYVIEIGHRREIHDR